MTLTDRVDLVCEAWGRLMVRWRWTVLVLALAFTTAMATRLPLIRTENSAESYLHSDDSAFVLYKNFGKQFGQDSHIAVAIPPPEIFDLHFLERLRDFHHDVEAEVPYVNEVTSLLNARHTRGAGDVLIVEDLLEDWPATPVELAALRARVLSNPLYLDALISRDGELTTVTIEPSLYSSATDEGDVLGGFEHAGDSGEGLGAATEDLAFLSQEEKNELVEALDRVVRRHAGPDFPIYMAGGTVMAVEITKRMTTNVGVHMSATLVAIMLFLLVLFRRVSAMLLTLAVVTAALISTLGTMVLLDIPFSTVLGMLPVFSTTVGVCTAVHILVIVYQQLTRGYGRPDAVAYAFRHSGLSILMASTTTAAGMLSFLGADLAPIQHLGITAPFAVFYAFAFTITLLPALIGIVPLTATDERGGATTWPQGLLARTGALATAHPWPILLGASVVVLIAVAGMTQLRFSFHPLMWFPADDPFRVATELLDRKLRGTVSIEVVVDTGTENGLYEPATLNRMEAAMRHAESLRQGDIFIGKAVSIVDIIKETNQALHANDEAYYTIPQERALVAQELLLFENSGSDDLEKVTDSHFRTARLSMRIPAVDAIAYGSFLEKLEAHLRPILGDDLPFVVNGRTTLMARGFTALITSMGRSYVIALALITPLMILLVGNLRLGIISMIPNLLPVIVTLGLMGWMEIALDAANIVVGSIIIGLAVDDTIHFLQRFRKNFEREPNVDSAVRTTMQGTGVALFFTSLVLATGFAIIGSLGSMANTIHFGGLSAFGITVAFIADVLITPALLAVSLRAPQPSAFAFPQERNETELSARN